MSSIDVEELRQMFSDRRLHIAIGQIKKLMLAKDRSALRVLVSMLPEQREIIARMSWGTVGEDAGFYQFPRPDDLVIVAMANGDEDTAFVLTKLTTKEDKIPLRAADGDMVAKALTGTKLWLSSDEAVNISRGETAPTENLVLGQVFKTMMSQLLQALSEETHLGNMGYQTSVPLNASTYTSLKSNPIDNEDVLSDFAFTEK